MLKKNRDEIMSLTSMARRVFNVVPDSDESTEYVKGFYESQAETVAMILNRIDTIVNKKEEDEF